MIKNQFSSLGIFKYLVFFVFVSSVSQANSGDVYSCQMKRFIFLENEEVSYEALDEFSFEVMQDAVQFGEGGFFDATNIPIIMNNKGWVHASDDLSVFILKDGKFYYSMVTYLNVRAIEGNCYKVNKL
jgi:hypothetical protein